MAKKEKISKEEAELIRVFTGNSALTNFERPNFETRLYLSTQDTTQGRRTFRRTDRFTTGSNNTPRPQSELANLFHFGTRGFTKNDGIAEFKLSEVCEFEALFFQDPMAITATSNLKPAIMIVEYKIIPNDGSFAGTDVQLTVTSLDTNGDPLPNVKFSLHGTLPYDIGGID